MTNGVSNKDFGIWYRTLCGPETLEIHLVEASHMLLETKSKFIALLTGVELISSFMYLLVFVFCLFSDSTLNVNSVRSRICVCYIHCCISRT